MIKISKRLSAIASFVKDDAKVVDIGCDHALLDIYLAEKHPHISVIAVDVKKGALSQALANTQKHSARVNVNLRLGDGLNVVDKDEINTIIIAGVGCPTIIDVLTKDKDKLSNVEDLIIQSNNNYYQVRKTICKAGYFIKEEQLVKEIGIIYLIIHFKKGKDKYSHNDYLFGPFLRKNKTQLYSELMDEDLKKKEILYNLIPLRYFLRKWSIKRSILRLQKEIR